jgi:hypothetical protein
VAAAAAHHGLPAHGDGGRRIANRAHVGRQIRDLAPAKAVEPIVLWLSPALDDALRGDAGLVVKLGVEAAGMVLWDALIQAHPGRVFVIDDRELLRTTTTTTATTTETTTATAPLTPPANF